jgi:hypothetical protein
MTRHSAPEVVILIASLGQTDVQRLHDTQAASKGAKRKKSLLSSYFFTFAGIDAKTACGQIRMHFWHSIGFLHFDTSTLTLMLANFFMK